ncbi:MAG: signal recognition particle-docking protein FtsY [Candidatus Parvarchaeota archaeon]|nr:signal recognition particle-docking protein FtsY [Candidatus Parvarchaeota archaeon]
MFDFIKKKIKDSIDSITKKVKKEEKTEELHEEAHEAPQKAAEEKTKAPSSKPKKEEHNKQVKKRLLSHKITEQEVMDIYEGMRQALFDNNVAVSVLDSIKADLLKELVGQDVSLISSKKAVEEIMKKSVANILSEYPVDQLIEKIKNKKPFVILFVGVNGVGKTTTLAKVAKFLMDKGFKVVVSASDTFRAASIEQLEVHSKNLGINVIKHNYGSDPAAVAFDAIKHARTNGVDVVLVDTAGRSDINKNLLEELKKVKRVSQPDLTIFVGDALTGNDAVNQAQIFDREVSIDATILSKADVDKKGGAVLSISYITKKPIIFLGTGQGYGDLIPFNKERTADFLFS